MAAVRHSLQKQVFESVGERLLVYCEVYKLPKKKQSSYLCLISSCEVPSNINVTQVKKVDEKVYKKKRSWLISEIKSIDGGTESNVLALDITADKLYKWIALNEHDRRQFITALSQICQQNCERINFAHFPESWIGPPSPDSPETVPTRSSSTLETDVNDPKVLGDLDEDELAALLGGCDIAVEDAESFMRRLGDELLTLDGQNVAAVLASSTRVDALADKIEEAIAYADALDKRLERYDDLLRHVRDAVDKMEERNGSIEISNKNGRQLLKELRTIIQWLDMSHVTNEDNLATSEGRKQALNVAESLKTALSYKPPGYLLRLGAVQQQLRIVNKRKEKLVQAVTHYLNNLLIHLSNDASSELPMDGLILRNRAHIHHELKPYASLVHFVKEMDEKSFHALVKVYSHTLVKLYERDLKQFFETAKQDISNIINKDKRQRNESKEDLLNSSFTSSAKHYDTLLETVLSQLENVCSDEQDFCVMFFQLDQNNKNSDAAETDSTNSDKRNNQLGDDTRQMMSEIFPTIEQDLISLIMYYERHDGFGSIRSVAILGSHVLGAEGGWLIRGALASALVAAKRGADKTVADKLHRIQDGGRQAAKRNKCGVLPYLDEFQEFCTAAESIFSGNGRRADVERWYFTLAGAIVNSIASYEHPRTPHQVVKMENYHRLYDILSQLKLPALESIRKDVKNKYNDSLKAYVTHYFGRPLEKLNQFFERVSERIASGVREEEVLYQADFSKHELRRVLSLYTQRDVRRGLHDLYKTLEKHLCDEENLLQVVWRAMQEEFIAQYVYLEGRIQACYPGAMISLPFTMQDILDAFSDIAQSH